jgi:hypothetical protein
LSIRFGGGARFGNTDETHLFSSVLLELLDLGEILSAVVKMFTILQGGGVCRSHGVLWNLNGKS